jgi:hypothetical protein
MEKSAMRALQICGLFLGAVCSMLTAQDQVGAALSGVVARFDERYRVDVVQPFATGEITLNGRYVAALDQRREAAQKLGHLDEAIALKNEREQVLAGKPISDTDDDATPASLRDLRKTYRVSHSLLENERGNRLKGHYRAYTEALQALRLQLTKDGKFGEAKAVEVRLKETFAAQAESNGAIQTPGAVSAPTVASHPKSNAVPQATKSDDYTPAEYFKGEVSRDLDAAMERARRFQKPLWVVAYGSDDEKRALHWRLHYFMQLDETRQIVTENFEQVLLPFGSGSLKPILTSEDNTEGLTLFVLTPNGAVIKKLSMNHNGEDALRVTKKIVEQAKQGP